MKVTMNNEQPHMAENINMPGIRMTVILRTDCSGGKLTILEDEVAVGAGSPLHTCNRQDKVMMIVEGKFIITANGQQYLAEKGCNIFIQKGTIHSFKNVGTTTGKLLITLTPGAQTDKLKEFNRPVKVFGQTNAVLKEVACQYNVEMV